MVATKIIPLCQVVDAKRHRHRTASHPRMGVNATSIDDCAAYLTQQQRLREAVADVCGASF